MKILKNRVFIGVSCLVLAVLIAFVAVPVFNNLTTKTVEVMRVVADVGMGTRITEDMLEKVEIGNINLPSEPATNPKQIVGKYITVDMKAHDVVYANKVTDKLVFPENKLRQMQVGESAYTVKLGDSYRSRLLPNDIVSFYTFDEQGNAQVVPELQYVSVVTTTTSNKVDILYSSQVAADGSALVPDTITFILNKNQINKLLTLENQGKYKMTLVCRGTDEYAAQEYINQQNSYLKSQSSIAVTDIGEAQEQGGVE